MADIRESMTTSGDDAMIVTRLWITGAPKFVTALIVVDSVPQLTSELYSNIPFRTVGKRKMMQLLVWGNNLVSHPLHRNQRARNPIPPLQFATLICTPLLLHVVLADIYQTTILVISSKTRGAVDRMNSEVAGYFYRAMAAEFPELRPCNDDKLMRDPAMEALHLDAAAKRPKLIQNSSPPRAYWPHKRQKRVLSMSRTAAPILLDSVTVDKVSNFSNPPSSLPLYEDTPRNLSALEYTKTHVSTRAEFGGVWNALGDAGQRKDGKAKAVEIIDTDIPRPKVYLILLYEKRQISGQYWREPRISQIYGPTQILPAHPIAGFDWG
ncbi:hypothetical protein GG344DRAFT_66132 [Lentinula edodes]|nr:hypothetical protein GG344DRAFT_66132 [Lentinula edodes]